MSVLSTSTYQKTTIHDLFTEVFMKKDMHFCIENINKFDNYLNRRMGYFEEWKLLCKGKNKACQFLSAVTWQNLKLTIYGYIGYARQVLTACMAQYVPMLHANTSSLKATFLSICSLGGRNAASYKS